MWWEAQLSLLSMNMCISDNDGEKKIFHIDLYRLKDEEEAIQAGVEDCLYSDHISLVEWPERAPGFSRKIQFMFILIL